MIIWNISKSIGTAIFILLLFGGIATAIPIDKTTTLGPYVSGSKYYVHLYNVDDTAKATVNNGLQVVQTGYYQDSGWIDITSNLKDGSNTILLTNENGPGGWTYGFEIKKDSNIIFKESCGKVGTEGCMNNDGTQGIVYRNIITLTLGGIGAAIPIDKTTTLGPYVSGSKYYVHLYNVDDTTKATVNNGLQVVQTGYYQDSGWIDITSNLKDGSNTILLTNENGPGGWTYGFEIKKDSNVIFTESCGKVGTEGCMNNDGTQGIVYRNVITLTLGASPTILETEATGKKYGPICNGFKDGIQVINPVCYQPWNDYLLVGYEATPPTADPLYSGEIRITGTNLDKITTAEIKPNSGFFTSDYMIKPKFVTQTPTSLTMKIYAYTYDAKPSNLNIIFNNNPLLSKTIKVLPAFNEYQLYGQCTWFAWHIARLGHYPPQSEIDSYSVGVPLIDIPTKGSILMDKNSHTISESRHTVYVDSVDKTKETPVSTGKIVEYNVNGRDTNRVKMDGTISTFTVPMTVKISLDGKTKTITKYPYIANLYMKYTINDPTTYSADLNSDGYVNSVDLGILMSYWGDTTRPPADINQDGIVNSVDSGIMMSMWTG